MPAADRTSAEKGFVSLFDGKTLDGWKVGENAHVFHVRDGMIENAWYTQEVIYRNGLITVRLDGNKLFDYNLPQADVEHKLPTPATWLPRGTFALQGHPPMPGHISKALFKNIRVKVLPD